MFIRWKIKPCRRSWWNKEDPDPRSYSAYLVQSVRKEGKSRQRQYYLASITTYVVDSPKFRQSFWEKVERKLSQFKGNLTPEQLDGFKQKLLEQVPQVTPEQLAEEQRLEEAKYPALYRPSE